MNDIKEARLKAKLSQSKMSKLFNIPLRNIERWEAGDTQPSAWVKELLLKELERLGKQVEERQRLDAHIIGYLYGYIEGLFIDNRNWEAIPNTIHTLSNTDPIKALLQLMDGVKNYDIKLDNDFVSILMSNINFSDYEDKNSDNIKFNNYPVNFVARFQFARIMGQNRSTGRIIFRLHQTRRTPFDMLQYSGFTEEEVVKLLTGYLNPKNMTGEMLQKLADYLRCTPDYLSRETNDPKETKINDIKPIKE